MKKTIFIILLSLFSDFSQAAVILVYHHVSDNTPTSTSIAPAQFERHLAYLKQQQFKVVGLNELVTKLKSKQPISDKTVVITFDDGYSDILENAHPLLTRYNYPYTIFLNPGTVPEKTGRYLNWQDIRHLSDSGVLIANHGLMHDSLVKVPTGQSNKQWLAKKLTELQQAEALIKQHTGQQWQYFALPYGEYTVQAQQWLEHLGYVVFTQQSGAVGMNTDLTAIPRFPASMPYDKLNTLKDKLLSLPFNVSTVTQRASTVVAYADSPPKLPGTSISLRVADFKPQQLQCFITGMGKVDLQWQQQQSFTMVLNTQLNAGRQRSNCTAPSVTKPGRFYWYSKPWFVKNKDGTWYHN